MKNSNTWATHWILLTQGLPYGAYTNFPFKFKFICIAFFSLNKEYNITLIYNITFSKHIAKMYTYYYKIIFR